MSQRRHDGGERGGGASWLPRARALPKEQQTHQVRPVKDGAGTPVWYDFIQPGNRIVRIDTFFRDDRPLTAAEYVQRLRERGYWVQVEEDEA